MKDNHGQFAIAGAVVVAAIICAFAVLRLAQSIETAQRRETSTSVIPAPEPYPKDLGRFQIALTRGANDSVIAFRIDTTNGSTAKFNSGESQLVTDDSDYLKDLGLTKAGVQKFNADGYRVMTLPFWRGVDEKPSAFTIMRK